MTVDTWVQIVLGIIAVFLTVVIGFTGFWARSISTAMRTMNEKFDSMSMNFNKLATDHGVQASQLLDVRGDVQSLQIDQQRQWTRLDDDRERLIKLELRRNQHPRHSEEASDNEDGK